MNKITKEQKIDIYRFWEINSHLSNEEKTTLYNKENGTNFVTRSLQQIHSNVKSGVDYALKDLKGFDKELFAKKEFNVLTQQKKNVILKRVAHKEARKAANWDFFKKDWIQRLNEIEPKRLKPLDKKIKSSSALVIVKGDDHFRGYEEDKKVQRDFYKKVYNIGLHKNKTDISLLFGGDEIEGWLHDNTLKYASLTPEEQMKLFVEETISGIDLLASKFNVHIYMLTSSNHNQSRPLKSGRNTHLKADISLMGAEMIKMAFRNRGNVKIETAPVFRARKIKGLKGASVALTHGGLGFEKTVSKLVNHYNESDLIIKAHTHSFKVENEMNTTVITIPTLKTFVTEFELNNGYVKLNESVDAKDYKWESEFLELEIVKGDLSIIKRRVNV